MKRTFIIYFSTLLLWSLISPLASAVPPVPPSCAVPCDVCSPTCAVPQSCLPDCAAPQGCSSCNSCNQSCYTPQSTCSCSNGGRCRGLFGGMRLFNYTKIEVENEEKCCQTRGGSVAPAGSPTQPAGTPTFSYAPVPITLMAYQPMMMQPSYNVAAAPAVYSAPRPAAADDCNLRDVCDKLKVLESQLSTLRSTVDKMDAHDARLTALETAVKKIDEANRKQTEILEKLGQRLGTGFTPVPEAP